MVLCYDYTAAVPNTLLVIVNNYCVAHAVSAPGQFLPPRLATAMEELVQKPDAKAPTALPLYD
jgi:hypothetical protein